MRNFDEWLSTMCDNIFTWEYYTDFEKVYKNVDDIKIQLNILNSLIGSENIKEDFINLATKYPEIIPVIPILIAKRIVKSSEVIPIRDMNVEYNFNFKKMNYSLEEYAMFMEKTGLFHLISKKIINNLIDYVLGVEVGLDSNARKNRTGHLMEDLVEAYLMEAGFERNKNLFKEMYQDEVENKFGVDLSKITNKGKTQKRFDFVVESKKHIYLIETNFYNSGGSKLNETARSYKMIASEAMDIPNVSFVWITDGKGWTSAKKNLYETFEILPTLYNLNDLKNGILKNWKGD